MSIISGAAVLRGTPLAATGIIAGLMAVPFLYGLLISLRDPAEVLAAHPHLWPPRLDAYLRIWQLVPLARYLFNSLLVSTAVTIGATFTSILAAYVFARASFRGRDVLFLGVLATLMVPAHITLIPNYLLMAQLGLLDSYGALILPFLANGFAIFFLRQHFRAVPRAYDEAALIDGASSWHVLWQIIVPLTRPAIASAALFIFLGEWNSYIWPRIVTDGDAVATAQIGLARLYAKSTGEGLVDWPLVLAASMTILVPTLIAFALVQRRLVRGVMLGGIK
jgi:multiple sugar transport system permease protein/sn-glycerol 3-phosphate transport system permease protein